MVMLAKGNRSQQVTDACKKHGGFYLGSAGGPAALLAQEQEMADFIGCIRNGGTPTETAADGRAVLEIMIAGYLSAATGRKVTFPFDDPADYEAPVELWLRARRERGA